ncbi:hemoglobin/transferrin/lactoferrin receptor protein [Marinoscillum furvescens DSM 4134]|uniref:Hemoglobin/transferrin/lactoferrin receptor protein n=2 Tax=Marinoscillum furvescens TaxID=1026 RepID=A0A3D9L9M4_MARFU|nr:hemoglobin/transferrin/lactoferrin receptor protein [Marinoscillum furvescens DSM 4134]
MQVIDETTGESIENVYIYHENQSFSTLTSADGTADLSACPAMGIVILQHPAYQSTSLAYSELIVKDFRVELMERILLIDEVTVTANRWEQNKGEVSQDILAISPKTASFQNPETSADLLAETGQVYVQKSQLGGGSPMLRGFAANSVLLVVDGVRLNNAIFRSGNLQNVINIDPNALEGAEVIYGPGSVMYGSDALGGVMDFHTKGTRFTTLDKPQVRGNAMARYGSAANEKTGHLDFSVYGKKFSYMGSISHTQLDDLKAGSKRTSGFKGHFERTHYVRSAGGADFLVTNKDKNLQKHSGYNLLNTIQKVRLKTGAKSDIAYGFYYSNTSDIPRYDRLTEKQEDSDSLIYADWYYGPQKWLMHTLTFSTFEPTAVYSQAKVTLAYQQYEESRNDRKFGDDRLRTRTETVDLYNVTLDLDRKIGKANLYYGVDFIFNDVQSSGYRKNLITGEKTETSSRYPDGGSTYITTAAYANLSYKPSPRWVLNMGARYSDVRLKASTTDATASSFLQEDLDLQNQAVNGMAGVIFNPWASTRIKALLSTGFRAPNVDDVGKVFEVDDHVVVVPNPNLKPEYSYNQELAIQQRIGKVYVDLVGYHSMLTDAIVRSEFTVNGSNTIELDGDTKEVRAQVNAEQAKIYGASAQVKTEITPSLAFTSSITLSKGYETGSNEPLRHVPPAFGRSAVIYQIKKLRAELYSMYNLHKTAAQIPSSEIDDKPHLYTDEGSPAWATLNIKSQYVLSETFTVQAGIENILDLHYRTYSSGISAPGRNISATLRASF